MSLHGPARLLDLGAGLLGVVGFTLLGIAHWLIGDDEPGDVLIWGDEDGLV